MLKGQTPTLKKRGESTKVSWKQGSFMGFGGGMHETYVLCKYSAPSKHHCEANQRSGSLMGGRGLLARPVESYSPAVS